MQGMGKTNEKEWVGRFPEYYTLVKKNKHYANLSTQRLYRMIMSHGTTIEDGKVKYNFFKNKIFGADEQIDKIMKYFKAASMGLDIKKRVLLLLGPPGGGKSMILSLLKKGLADFSHTPEGAIYAIKDCPIQEDPLHLLSEEDRQTLYKTHGIKIEGKLCPKCQFNYEQDWHRNINNVQVKRVYISEENRSGIGTFAPAERNDMVELYGSADLSRIEYYGSESDSRAYSFDGELHKANRGIMEFIEILKAKSDFLHILLTLAEEQQFKTPRFPLQYVDETLIAHTNEGEFQKFISIKENEAVIDRLYIVRTPYNMDYQYEEQIYHAALQTKLVVKDIEVHPGAIRLASMFVVKTRYNKDPLRQGMSGISPRFVLNSLAIAMVEDHVIKNKIVTPIDMSNVLKKEVQNYPVFSLETRELYLNYLKELDGELNRLNHLKKEELHLQVTKKSNSFFDVIID